MARKLVIRYVRRPVDFSRFYNFGDDVMRVFDERGWAAPSWDWAAEPGEHEVADLERSIKRRFIGDALHEVDKLIAKHFLRDEVTVEVLKVGDA